METEYKVGDRVRFTKDYEEAKVVAPGYCGLVWTIAAIERVADLVRRRKHMDIEIICGDLGVGLRVRDGDPMPIEPATPEAPANVQSGVALRYMQKMTERAGDIQQLDEVVRGIDSTLRAEMEAYAATLPSLADASAGLGIPHREPESDGIRYMPAMEAEPLRRLVHRLAGRTDVWPVAALQPWADTADLLMPDNSLSRTDRMRVEVADYRTDGGWVLWAWPRPEHAPVPTLAHFRKGES